MKRTSSMLMAFGFALWRAWTRWTKKEAKAYLERKDKDVTDEEIEKVMKEGKIYGDPMAVFK